MLSTLARIANQLENDGHKDLADEADQIITSLANRDSWVDAPPGSLWNDETEDMETQEPEEVSEEGFSVQEDPKELGMGTGDTFSAVLADHKDAFKRYIASHEDTAAMVRSIGTRTTRILPAQYIEDMVENLGAVFDELSASGQKPVSRDDGFEENARRLIQEVGFKALRIRA